MIKIPQTSTTDAVLDFPILFPPSQGDVIRQKVPTSAPTPGPDSIKTNGPTSSTLGPSEAQKKCKLLSCQRKKKRKEKEMRAEKEQKLVAKVQANSENTSTKYYYH